MEIVINCYGVDCSAWTYLHHAVGPDWLGYLPDFIVNDDPRPAREQFDERYIFGGWRPQPGWTRNPETGAMKYPGDPAMKPIAERRLRDELILLYASSYVAIVQPDGSFEMARVD